MNDERYDDVFADERAASLHRDDPDMQWMGRRRVRVAMTEEQRRLYALPLAELAAYVKSAPLDAYFPALAVLELRWAEAE